MSLAPGCRRPSAFLLLTALLLAACGPEPTPLPVAPVATPSLEATAAPTAETLLTDNVTLGLLPDAVRFRLEETVVFAPQPLPLTEPGPAALSLLPFAGSAPADYSLPAAFRLNTARAPLTDATLADTLAAFLTAPGERVAESAELRAALANAGYPDGVTLAVTADAALWPIWSDRLAGGPVRWVPELTDEEAHLTLAAGADAEALLAAGGTAFGALPLYAAGWQVTADEAGLPALIRDG